MSKYTIERTSLAANEILSLQLRAKSQSDVFGFRPGQYATIGFRKGLTLSPRRCFSFANSPTDKGILEFGIRIGGNYTQSLAKLKVGDEVEIQGPFGEFLSAINADDDLVFFAGGIGITPFMSVIRNAAATNQNQKITLFYSIRSSQDAAYTSELFEIKKNMPNLNIALFLSQEDGSKYKNPAVFSGKIDSASIAKILDNNFDAKKYFLCGPPPFMEAMKQNLVSYSVSQAKIKTEEFSSSGNAPGTESDSPEKRVPGYVLAFVFTLFVFVAIKDSVAYQARLDAANQTTTPANSNSSVKVDNSSQSNSASTDQSSNSTNSSSSTSSSSSSIGSSSSPSPSSQNQYSQPRTRVS